MSKIIFRLLIVFLITFLSCNKDDSPVDSGTSNDFIPFPLTVGNTWIYHIVDNNATHIDTYFIAKTKVIKSNNVYITNEDYFDYEGWYYLDGNLYAVNFLQSDSTSELFFPKNPTTGQTWSTYETGPMRLESLNEKITVQAGTFNCSKIIFTSIPAYVWYANNIGVIKFQSSDNSAELLSYHIN